EVGFTHTGLYLCLGSVISTMPGFSAYARYSTSCRPTARAPSTPKYGSSSQCRVSEITLNHTATALALASFRKLWYEMLGYSPFVVLVQSSCRNASGSVAVITWISGCCVN